MSKFDKKDSKLLADAKLSSAIQILINNITLPADAAQLGQIAPTLPSIVGWQAVIDQLKQPIRQIILFGKQPPYPQFQSVYLLIANAIAAKIGKGASDPHVMLLAKNMTTSLLTAAGPQLIHRAIGGLSELAYQSAKGLYTAALTEWQETPVAQAYDRKDPVPLSSAVVDAFGDLGAGASSPSGAGAYGAAASSPGAGFIPGAAGGGFPQPPPLYHSPTLVPLTPHHVPVHHHAVAAPMSAAPVAAGGAGMDIKLAVQRLVAAAPLRLNVSARALRYGCMNDNFQKNKDQFRADLANDFNFTEEQQFTNFGNAINHLIQAFAPRVIQLIEAGREVSIATLSPHFDELFALIRGALAAQPGLRVLDDKTQQPMDNTQIALQLTVGFLRGALPLMIDKVKRHNREENPGETMVRGLKMGRDGRLVEFKIKGHDPRQDPVQINVHALVALEQWRKQVEARLATEASSSSASSSSVSSFSASSSSSSSSSASSSSYASLSSAPSAAGSEGMPPLPSPPGFSSAVPLPPLPPPSSYSAAPDYGLHGGYGYGGYPPTAGMAAGGGGSTYSPPTAPAVGVSPPVASGAGYGNGYGYGGPAATPSSQMPASVAPSQPPLSGYPMGFLVNPHQRSPAASPVHLPAYHHHAATAPPGSAGLSDEQQRQMQELLGRLNNGRGFNAFGR